METSRIYPNCLNNFKIYKIKTIGDGSCYFHAVLMAISMKYRRKDYFERVLLARDLRNALADVLDEEYYNLSGGKLEEFSREYKQSSLDYMKRELRSRIPVDNKYHELVSNELSLDIYIIEKKYDRVYNFGKDNLYYKERDSVILYYDEDGCHFELLSVCNNNGLQTVFEANSPVIKNIKVHLK